MSILRVYEYSSSSSRTQKQKFSAWFSIFIVQTASGYGKVCRPIIMIVRQNIKYCYCWKSSFVHKDAKRQTMILNYYIIICVQFTVNKTAAATTTKKQIGPVVWDNIIIFIHNFLLLQNSNGSWMNI